MKITNEILENLLNDINYLVNRNFKTYRFAKRNGFTYIEEIKTNNTLFNYAITKKEIYAALQGFREGLYINIDK